MTLYVKMIVRWPPPAAPREHEGACVEVHEDRDEWSDTPIHPDRGPRETTVSPDRRTAARKE